MALQKKYIAVALAIIAAMMATTVVALLQTSKTIPSSGTISAFKVGVYANTALDDPLYKVNWTNVNPGSNTTQTIYVKNEAGSLSLNLSMTPESWSATPTNATTVAYLTWDKGGTELAAGENVTAVLTLLVLDNNQTQTGLTFDVNIKIIGDES